MKASSSSVLAVLALIAGASVIDAAGSYTHSYTITNQAFADYSKENAQQKATVEAALTSTMNGWMQNQGLSTATATGTDIEIDGDKVVAATAVTVSDASDDADAESKVKDFVSSNKDIIKSSLEAAISPYTSGDVEIDVNMATAVRVGLGAVAGAVMSMLLLA